MIFASIFLSGVCMTAFAACGVFFLRFWKTSRDQFFLRFGAACFLLAAERIVSLILFAVYKIESGSEAAAWSYLLRLSAFLIIFFAIFEKNKGSSRKITPNEPADRN